MKHIQSLGPSILLLLCSTAVSAQTSIIREPWYESQVDSNAITFTWNTAGIMESYMRVGLTKSYELGLQDGGNSLMHSVRVTGLTPSTTYVEQLIAGSDTVSMFSSTASDYRSTGAIEVYFNRSADTMYRGELSPVLYNQDYMALLHEKILGAKASIDLAVYSYSGVTGDTVTAWLIAAKQRGIKVRLIADSISANDSPPYLALSVAGIPTILNSFGNNANVASHIHHNKFIVIDGRTDDGANVWVLSGSWNLSDQQTTTDYQNVIHFQDMSLARTFEREFNEEWGSAKDLPDARYARFSTNKHDTTARTFSIHNIPVHLFFSPNGGAFLGIDSTLARAKKQVLYALFVFTREELAQTLIADHLTGVDIHGIDNGTDKYEQTPVLQAAGIDALAFIETGSILLHHKYAILDVESPSATVITGSYNWSATAEDENNENLLIIQNNSIAEQYVQEWLARYHGNGGTQAINIPLSVNIDYDVARTASIYPNPTHSEARVAWTQSGAGAARIVVVDAMGRTVAQETVVVAPGNNEHGLPAFLQGGVYWVTIEHDRTQNVVKVMVVR
jgi:phosphatidylserine/phosphatidylglycerophosphate/cardiolipin synthase-like enzyme